jgi:hypothetical protein
MILSFENPGIVSTNTGDFGSGRLRQTPKVCFQITTPQAPHKQLDTFCEPAVAMTSMKKTHEHDQPRRRNYDIFEGSIHRNVFSEPDPVKCAQHLYLARIASGVEHDDRPHQSSSVIASCCLVLGFVPIE